MDEVTTIVLHRTCISISNHVLACTILCCTYQIYIEFSCFSSGNTLHCWCCTPATITKCPCCNPVLSTWYCSIVTFIPLPVFTYSPIIGTPKRNTSYPAMTLVALPCAVVSYTTCELVTSVTVTPGGGTESMCVGGEKRNDVHVQYAHCYHVLS